MVTQAMTERLDTTPGPRLRVCPQVLPPLPPSQLRKPLLAAMRPSRLRLLPGLTAPSQTLLLRRTAPSVAAPRWQQPLQKLRSLRPWHRRPQRAEMTLRPAPASPTTRGGLTKPSPWTWSLGLQVQQPLPSTKQCRGKLVGPGKILVLFPSRFRSLLSRAKRLKSWRLTLQAK